MNQKGKAGDASLQYISCRDIIMKQNYTKFEVDGLCRKILAYPVFSAHPMIRFFEAEKRLRIISWQIKVK